LESAYYLIKDKGMKPSEIYLDLGFTDLSHFSFAFKKAYQIPPSKLLDIKNDK
jgi:AraC-like DNA-binding protein